MNNILTSKGSIANNQRGGRTGQDQQCNVVTLFFGIQHFYSSTKTWRAKQGPMSGTRLQGGRCKVWAKLTGR